MAKKISSKSSETKKVSKNSQKVKTTKSKKEAPVKEKKQTSKSKTSKNTSKRNREENQTKRGKTSGDGRPSTKNSGSSNKSSRNRNNRSSRTPQKSGSSATLFIIIGCLVLGLIGVGYFVFRPSDKPEQPQQKAKKTPKPTAKTKQSLPLKVKKAIFNDAQNNEDIAAKQAKEKFPDPVNKVNDIEGRSLRKKRNAEKNRIKRQLDAKVAEKYNVSVKNVMDATDDGFINGW